MKLSFLLALCLGAQAVSMAAEPTGTTGARPAQNAVSDTEQAEPFHDPFAIEGEANKPQAPVWDPLEPMNRAFFTFNDKLYYWILRPVARGYNKVAPEPFRQSIKRLFVNARYPVRLANNLLQLKMREAAIETARFVLNSTIGVGGLFDPARDEFKLQPYVEDLDQTLGFYRLPPGPYINWPLMGPSSVRGTVGMVGDSFLVPWNYVDEAVVLYGSRVLDTINSTSLQLGEYENFKRDTLDPYVALRDAYFQNRAAHIHW